MTEQGLGKMAKRLVIPSYKRQVIVKSHDHQHTERTRNIQEENSNGDIFMGASMNL